MTETNISRYKKRAIALAVASCMSLSPWVAEAAGLGKLTVLSGLGQPLRAELELAATPDELAGMTARLATADAFKQAGIDYFSTLTDLRFAVDKRGNGLSVVKVSSLKPINEPFLDFLVELNWPAGRLVREYTFLLDPPEVSGKQPSRSVVDAQVVQTVRGGGAADIKSAPAPKVQAKSSSVTPKLAEEPKKLEEKPEKQVGGESHVVQRGETLRKIASDTIPEGVSLEQMLVGLFRANPDAFVGNNLNRLKTGAILSIPEKSAVESISQAEAKRIYISQSGDWNSYRQKLAASTAKAPAKDAEGAAQASSGKIAAKVEEKIAPAEKSKDQVKVARADGGAKGADAAKSAGEEDKVAREKAYKEAQERLVSLEKNVNDLQKLLELKNQKLAELQQPPKKEEPKPVVEAVKPAETPKPEVAKPVEPAVPAVVPQPDPAKAVEEPKPAAEPAPAPVEAPKPEPKKPVPPPPPPEPEPGLLDALLEDPLPLAAGGGLLALLGGFLVFRRRRSVQPAMATTTAPVPSSLGPNSVFRMTGGQSVDTGNTPPQTGDFSQTGPGTIDTDEVDPVAEADVYMAYGRDTQAEEILLEALQKDPQRTAIHAKLLEIYANRGSVKQFETLAGELYAQTGGQGLDWAKAAELGARLDSSNPLYSGVVVSDVAASAPVVDSVASEFVPASVDEAHVAEAPSDGSFDRNTVILPDQAVEASEAPAEPDFDIPVAEPAIDEMALDFELGDPVLDVASASSAQVDTSAADAVDALDFDLGEHAPVAAPVTEALPAFELPAEVEAPQPEVPPVVASGVGELAGFSGDATLVMPAAMVESGVMDLGDLDLSAPADAALDFDFDVPPPASENSPLVGDISLEAPASPAPASGLLDVSPAPMADDDLDFDVSLGESMFMGQPTPNSEFDMAGISLDLSPEPVRDARWEEVNTKLDLAKAYEEMGDLEGARELLREVVAEGVPDLVEQAQGILARVGA